MDKHINVLGVRITQTTKKEVLKTVEFWLGEKTVSGSRFIATPNPEILVLASRDGKFRGILNEADLAICDGIGLFWVTKLFGSGVSERITGTDLMLELCQLACLKGYTVGLLGGAQDVAKKTAEVLKSKFPGIQIGFAESDFKRSSCDLLFVAFGAPKQEEFIYEQVKSRKKINFKVGMGVGGAFDMISGKIKRAPVWMQKIGLEWLWRLFIEPRRLKRIITATIIFPILVIKSLFRASR